MYMYVLHCTCAVYNTVEEVLKRAHVPPRHGVYVERKAMIQNIRKELYKLKDQDGYAFCGTCTCTYITWVILRREVKRAHYFEAK